MAHPKRKKMVETILQEIPGTPVVWDKKNSIHDTWERSWKERDKTADYHLVVQDDAILCDDFLQRVYNWLNLKKPVYNFHCRKRDNLLKESKDITNGYFEFSLWGGVAVCIKEELIDPMINWCMGHHEKHNFTDFDDMAMMKYFNDKKIKTCYPIPSLVDHSDSDTLIPQFYSRRTIRNFRRKGRETIKFIDDVFYNKKVCLIGAAPYITERMQSEYINSFDTVCRINWALPLTKELKKSTGDRCDVLYIYPKVQPHKSWKNVEVRLKTLNHHKYVRLKEKNKKFNIRKIPDNTYYNIEKVAGCVPNMGILAMEDILKSKPKELYVTGFSFYEGEEVFYDGYKNPHAKIVRSKKGNVYGHDQKKLKKYFFDYIYNEIHPDPFLEEMHELNTI